MSRRWLHLAMALLTPLLMAGAGNGVWAHPHVLIGQTVRFIASNGQFTHVEVEWAFDPFSSDLEIAAIDDDKDGKLSPKEEKELEKIALPELKRFGYLTWINSAGKDDRPSQAPTFKARIDNPASFVPGGWAPVPDAVTSSPSAGAFMGKDLPKPEPGLRNLVYVLRYQLPKPSKKVSVMAIDSEDYIRIEANPKVPFATAGDDGKARCAVDKHPEIKAEYMRGYPFFADRVTCTLP